MFQTVDEYSFTEGFKRAGRGDQFSYNGLKALYEYLEECEEDTEIPIEFDVIAFCCEFSEVESIEQFNYFSGEECKTLEDIREFTTVIEIENEEGFIIADY